ncbi:DUF423 domain-containing protein [Oricola sp.]|uniref:DUF423 domain-containing protein n=1 Tax=Oricola sp. TaxID=1979950 RepID=UPI0035115251
MSDKSAADSLALLGAGILGFAGVGAAAMSAHAGEDPRLASAVALVCLTHAPALLALGLLARCGLVLRIAALLLFVGATLFSGDIALRMFDHGRLFAMAAPAGGMTMMAGWIAVAIGAFTFRR